MELIALLFVLVVFNIAARLWGVDSRDGIHSREWEMRQVWPGFH